MLLYCYCELRNSKNQLFLQKTEIINDISYCPNSTFRYTGDATDLGRYGFVLLWSETSSLLLKGTVKKATIPRCPLKIS